MFLVASSAANAAAFDVYRSACLDTGVDLLRIRAASKVWTPLSDAEREQIAPGNGRGVEGWAIVQAGNRYLVNISTSRTGDMSGDRAGSAVFSCSLLTPKSDEKAALKSYSDYLKRPPSTTEAFEGMSTYTWSVQDPSGIALHYLVAGGNLPGLSLSVSSIRK
jgi:hypothetical protein